MLVVVQRDSVQPSTTKYKSIHVEASSIASPIISAIAPQPFLIASVQLPSAMV